MLIRKGISTDAAAIIAHNIAMALETENKALDPNITGPGTDAVFLDESKGFYLVAEINGKVVGNLMITYEWSDWRNGNIWWFQSVYVKPEFRGKGVFRSLFEEAVKMAKSSNAKEMRLYVETENMNAQRTYEKLGMNASHYRMFELGL